MNSWVPNVPPGARIWKPTLYSCAACAILALGQAQLSAAPQRNGAKSPSPAAEVGPLISHDDLESTMGKDLSLSPDSEKKADALAQFIQGSISEEDADIDSAMGAYRKVLTVDPAAKIREEEGSDALTLLSAKVAFALAQKGDPASGIDLLKDTLKAAPKDPQAYYFLSQLYSKSLNKYDIALKYAGQALDLDPRNFAYYEANYDLELNLGQTKKADEVLDRAAKADTDDPQFWLDLGDIYVSRIKENEPIPPDDLQKMNAVFAKTADLGKDNPFVLIKVADYDSLTKQVAQAIPLYQKALGMKADSSDPALIEAHQKLADCFLVENRKDDAIQALQDLVKADPLSSSAYVKLGQLYNDKQDYPRALDSFQQNLLLNPGDPRNYLVVMDLELRLKKFDQAVDVMSEAHRKFPEAAPITYRLAVAFAADKKNGEALAAFEQAESTAKLADKEMLDGQFYYDYGTAAGQAGQIDRATSLLNQSITIDPEGKSLGGYPGSAYNDLGYLWVDHDQRIDEGGQLIQRALEMEPANPSYIDSLGWYYFKKGDLSKAVEQLQKAVQATKPEDATVDDHLAQAYEKLGKLSEALACWQKAVALDPDNKDIAKRLEAAKQKATPKPQ